MSKLFRNVISASLMFVVIISCCLNLNALDVARSSVTVYDNAGILSSDEISSIESMDLNLLNHGVVLVETMNNYSSESSVESFAHSTAESYSSALVLVIDMNCRYVYMSASGKIKSYVGNEECYAITDNIYKYLSNGNYYEGIREALSEADTLSKGGHIKKPMKMVCTLFVSIFLSAVFVMLWLFGRISVKVRDLTDKRGSLILSNQDYRSWDMRFIKSRKVTHSSSSGSGGSGGGGGHSSGGGHSF